MTEPRLFLLCKPVYLAGMLRLRHLAVLFAFLAALMRPAAVSALAPASLEARVGHFEVGARLLVGEACSASREQQQKIGAAYDENASGYRFAAGGAKSAFEVAQAGGKHAGFLKNYLGRSPAEVQRGITSLERQVAEHQAKIANPEKFIQGWSKLDPRQQQALVNSKWPSDIQRQTEQIEILKGLLGGGQ